MDEINGLRNDMNRNKYVWMCVKCGDSYEDDTTKESCDCGGNLMRKIQFMYSYKL